MSSRGFTMSCLALPGQNQLVGTGTMGQALHTALASFCFAARQGQEICSSSAPLKEAYTRAIYSRRAPEAPVVTEVIRPHHLGSVHRVRVGVR